MLVRAQMAFRWLNKSVKYEKKDFYRVSKFLLALITYLSVNRENWQAPGKPSNKNAHKLRDKLILGTSWRVMENAAPPLRKFHKLTGLYSSKVSRS